MFSIGKRYLSGIVATLLLVSASLGMVHYKQLLESSPKEVYETYFLISQVLFFGVIAYFLVSWIFKLVSNYRLLKNEKIEAELSLLKSKIDPHFFFNTLNNLYGLAIAKSDKTPGVIQKLSEIMRYTIYEGEKHRTPLKSEINYLEEYIDIQKIRYKKNVDIQFNKEVADDSTMVAPLLFIMLVENAFKHGIESLTEDAFVHIHLVQQDDTITFEVTNNFETRPETTNGLGLKNLKKRLQHLYTDRHRLVLEKEENVYCAKITLKTK
ncbi:sensor histidine kinase [Fulvivirga sp. RKSG066]|uniref:sensor histidine kinase n=1 Tax=Fulvivirga aurantia TaxID=2529383 RepID=UPI0012BCC80F|nr:histidine kinase [Fulvivirga aurantia]MTI22695.1 sensor histidine kinase [Fulvivirga aurantia]